ncbi:ATP-grasp domain-containing protein [Solicola sp. PLA-1-18]|uniref:ATP-grasp domain-containing protein n=1 Tax=Solicola sp. PLA-1-18 TaxID=3380532 RepID=UPI003B8260A2
MPAPTVALATSADQLGRDVELGLVTDALAELGIEATAVAWDEPDHDWAAHDLVVVRSCWDYTGRLEEFLGWARSVAHLANPVEVLEWNTDKTYLRDLDARGCPVIETVWDPTDVAELGDHGEWVCKPSVSAGSRDTARWDDAADALRHAREIVASGRTAMVQPYVASVDDEGETAMLFVDGAFSHSIRKGPLLTRGEGVRQDRDSRGDVTPRTPTPEQHDAARAALDVVATAVPSAGPLLYARVDLVTSEDGLPRVIELELTEPGLFLPWVDGAAERLAGAIRSRLSQ